MAGEVTNRTIFNEAVKEAWTSVYPMTGLPARLPQSDYQATRELATRVSAGFATFIGLPVRGRKSRRNADGTFKYGLAEAGLNFIGWPETTWGDMSGGRRALTVAAVVTTTLWHTLTLPLKFAQNILKVIEFLPKLASDFCLSKSSLSNSAVGSGFFGVLGYLTYALYFVGRAIASPIQGIRKAFRQQDINPRSLYKAVLPTPARVILAVLSGVITATVYSFLLPIILPFIAAKIPFVAQSAAAFAQTKAGIWLGKVFATVGEYFNPIAGTVLEALGIAVAPSVVGAAVTVVSAVVIAAPAVDKMIDKVSDNVTEELNSSTKRVLEQVGSVEQNNALAREEALPAPAKINDESFAAQQAGVAQQEKETALKNYKTCQIERIENAMRLIEVYLKKHGETLNQADRKKIEDCHFYLNKNKNNFNKLSLLEFSGGHLPKTGVGGRLFYENQVNGRVAEVLTNCVGQPLRGQLIRLDECWKKLDVLSHDADDVTLHELNQLKSDIQSCIASDGMPDQPEGYFEEKVRAFEGLVDKYEHAKTFVNPQPSM